jgi:AraC-like DNA-binding protein
MRAAALAPFLRCAEELGLPVDRRLAEAGSPPFPWDDLERPIPALPVLRFLGDLARRDGVRDLGCRIPVPCGLLDHGRFGDYVLAGRTTRVVLLRTALAMPGFFNHQTLVLEECGAETRVRFVLPDSLDPVAVLVVHQYNARVVKMLLNAAAPGVAAVRRVELGPRDGADDAIEAAVTDAVVAGAPNALGLLVDRSVLDQPFPARRQSSGANPLPPLPHDFGISVACRSVIDLMLDDATPTIAGLAQALGLSIRTLQRELTAAGTSFKALLDDVRRARAMAALVAASDPMSRIAVDLGYAEQSSLSRAVRRWTGDAPQAFRSPDATDTR